MSDDSKRSDELQRLTEGKQANIIVELFALAKHTKKWWLLPVFAVLLGIGLFIALGGTAAAPFIYTLF